MDRALNPELLRQALGENPPQSLPSVEALSQLLSQAELALLMRNPGESNQLIGIGWYLHGVASSKYAQRVYGDAQQRSAFQVAGHIFDLLSKTPDIPQFDQLKYIFAAQVAYLRSHLDPNAIAVYNRASRTELSPLNFIDEFQQLALATGVALLGFDKTYVFNTSQQVGQLTTRLVNEWEIQTISNTPFAAAYGAILGARHLMTFLVYGRENSLQLGREVLRQAVNDESSQEDHISRWVAAHLLNLADGFQTSSIWNVLPPEVPSYVRKGFALGSPPVLTLWPPQLELFRTENNPLSSETKRLFLSTPTSGGKTLLAQLLIVSHLEIQKTAVCYVAPTRSLCREVKQSLAKRLSFIDAQVDITPDWDDGASSTDVPPEVEVMTPEQLAYRLRNDAPETLRRFGMFVFDEVHLVGEKGRGWKLEESLTYINHATQNTEHKIALISAVVGNRTHFIQWMKANDTEPIHTHSDWRGPRRIHAIYSNIPDWQQGVEKETKSKVYKRRTAFPLYGSLHVRISHTGKTRALRWKESVGDLVVNYKDAWDRNGKKDDSQSTPFSHTIVRVIDYLAETGSVLVIASTRRGAVQLAKTIVEKRDVIELAPIQHVLDLVEARLTVNHPLHRLLQRGVAYHHGSLPIEIRVALEEIVSEGYVNTLVATTTMTEGVNLPVQSVVIAQQGGHTIEGYQEYITGSKLINAIGRAGRATKETEGIVVLGWNQRLDDTVIQRLSPGDADLQVLSMLANTEALAELAVFEAELNTFEDAILEVNHESVSEFLKFVWFIAAQLEEGNEPVDNEHIEAVLQRSLGWVQLDENLRNRWVSVANLTSERYLQSDKRSRLRWAHSGTSLNSARLLENVAEEIAGILAVIAVPQSLLEIIDLILADGRLEAILQLPEFSHKEIYESRSGGGREKVEVPLNSILKDWVTGKSLLDLADTYLGRVRDIEFKFEQLGDFISNYFEASLPWIVSTLIPWVNESLEDQGNVLNQLPSDVSAYIRWGVDNPVAVELLNRGILSRKLALQIASAWKSDEDALDIYYWIRSMSFAEWQSRFEPSTAELRSLLDYSKKRRGGAAAELIRQESTQIEAEPSHNEYPLTEVRIRPIENTNNGQLGIFDGDEVIGFVHSRDHREIQDILSMGIAILFTFSASGGVGTLELKILNIDE